jgi:hypothetical protein
VRACMCVRPCMCVRACACVHVWVGVQVRVCLGGLQSVQAQLDSLARCRQPLSHCIRARRCCQRSHATRVMTKAGE